jgi:hypothetical protein
VTSVYCYAVDPFCILKRGASKEDLVLVNSHDIFVDHEGAVESIKELVGLLAFNCGWLKINDS